MILRLVKEGTLSKTSTHSSRQRPGANVDGCRGPRMKTHMSSLSIK